MDLHDDTAPSHVFDLPQLYTKPPATDILKALELLAARPRTFGNDAAPQVQPQFHPSGISQYLTSIIASALTWIDSDELREQIWETASARLCERSGRSAMPAMSREFIIPMTQNTDFPVTLYEPSITADNLGMKTWVSSYLLAKRLHSFLLPPSNLVPSTFKNNSRLRALELGAGTGLVGISFAALWGSAASIHLTDLEPIVPNLTHNVSLNQELLTKTGGSVTTGVLDWSHELGPLGGNEASYDVILAADPLYSPDHPRWLVQAIERRLNRDSESRVIVEMPLRDAYLPQVEEFKKRMQDIGLGMLAEGEEVGFDDWESKDGTSLEVLCWWSVWGRSLENKSRE
ncbi:hypothetical protein VTO42DRAFT_5941 [Malbranchea cinnamomea]